MTDDNLGYAQTDNALSTDDITVWFIIRLIANEWQCQGAGNRRSIRDNDETLEQFYAQVSELVQYVEAKAPPSVSPLACRLGCCLLVLGPQTPDAPPDEVWTALCRVAGTVNAKAAVEPLIDLVIAWGCGWGRTVQKQGNPWQARWPAAMIKLVRFVDRSILQTLKQLHTILSGTFYHLPKSEEIRMDAGIIALEIANDGCRCGNHTQAGLQQETHGDCQCCRPEHKLSNWQPTKQSLRAFVAQAARGNAGETLLAGAFTTSILYPRLNKEEFLTVGSVEFKECHVEGCLEEDKENKKAKAKEQQKANKSKYEGSRCHQCRTPFEPKQTRCFERKHWFFLPQEHGGPYRQMERWHCNAPECDNLYPIGHNACPRCGRPHPKRITHIWVYDTAHVWLENELTEDIPAADALAQRWADEEAEAERKQLEALVEQSRSGLLAKSKVKKLKQYLCQRIEQLEQSAIALAASEVSLAVQQEIKQVKQYLRTIP